jgi:VWFA-related protein
MIAAALTLFVLAQQAPFSEAIEVRLHNVDVIVTDKSGNAVTGLRKDDFELLQDGKPQTITNFAEYSEKAAASTAATPAAGSAAIATAPAPPPPRKIVFFVDDMSLHPMTRAKLARSAAETLQKTMREGDEAMVLRPAKSVSEKIPLQFSSDRAAVGAALAQAVDSNTFRPDVAFQGEMRMFLFDLARADDPKEALQIARRHAAKVRRRVELRLQALRAVIATLAPLPGRKVLVTVTESLPAQPGKEFFSLTPKAAIGIATLDQPVNFATASDYLKTDYFDFTPAIEELARSASSNGITIYSLRPEYDLRVSPAGPGAGGAGTYGGALNPTTGGGGGEAPEFGTGEVQLAMSNTDKTVDILTGKTGGKSFIGDARVDDALQTIASDLDSYYSLAYRAGDDVDKAHRIAVRIRNHPELTVRARNEVTRRSVKREMTDRVVAALMTTNVSNELGIVARAGTPARAKERGEYKVDVDIGFLIGKLTLLREGDVYRGKFTVHYAITGSATDFVSGVDPEQLVAIPAAEYAAARSKVWQHTLHVTMQKGDHQIAVGVLDGVGQTTGMTTLDVEIP